MNFVEQISFRYSQKNRKYKWTPEFWITKSNVLKRAKAEVREMCKLILTSDLSLVKGNWHGTLSDSFVRSSEWFPELKFGYLNLFISFHCIIYSIIIRQRNKCDRYNQDLYLLYFLTIKFQWKEMSKFEMFTAKKAERLIFFQAYFNVCKLLKNRRDLGSIILYDEIWV